MREEIPDKLYADFVETIEDYAPAEGLDKSPIERVLTAKYSHRNDYVKRQWHASLAIVAQGRKEILLENEICPCDPAHYTATLIPLPVASRVAQAAPDKPFLGILIEFEPDILNEVAHQIGNFSGAELNSPARAMYSGKPTAKCSRRQFA